MAHELNGDEIEQQRLERIGEHEAEAGLEWDSGFEPGTFGSHELLDRTYLVLNLLEQHILEHPACLREPAWYALAERASGALHELYQEVGAAQPEDAPVDAATHS